MNQAWGFWPQNK